MDKAEERREEEAGEEAAAGRSGRALVRDLLVDRLAEAGLQRRKGVSAEAQDRMLERLCDHLSYMNPENLRTLAELVIDHADGPGRCVWPAEVLVRGMASALQARPVTQHRIVTSWLASVEGPVAEAGGYLAELYRFLLKHRRPPLAMDARQLREEAAENNRRRGIVLDRIARGAASPEDRAWLARLAEDLREAQAHVDAGRAARAGGVQRTGTGG